MFATLRLCAVMSRLDSERSRAGTAPPTPTPNNEDDKGLELFTPTVTTKVVAVVVGGLGLVLVVALSPLLLLAVPLIVRKKRAAKRKLRQPAPQKPFDAVRAREPGKGTPLFHGVRVVELASFVAGPTVGRCMADLGAQVVKVEEPSGDPWRYTLLEFDQQPEPRNFSSTFEITAAGKLGVQLDLKNDDDKRRFKALLRDADVLVTNVRVDSLRAMNLHYGALAKEFPHLVYTHISAWGLVGNDYALAGYDIGAFWAGTGISAAINPEPLYSMYPAAFGDLATGQTLLGGIALALSQRLHTGKGQHVTSALLRSGTWCVSPVLLKTESAGPFVPNYRERDSPPAAYRSYQSQDDRSFAVLGLENLLQYSQMLKDAFSVHAQSDTELAEKLQAAFSNLSYAAISQVLTANGVPHCLMQSARDANTSSSELVCRVARCFDPPMANLTDIPRLPRMPYEFSCSAEHGPKLCAPQKGEHTDAVLKSGWSPVHEAAALPRMPRSTPRGSQALSGVLVVELSAVECTVSAACCMFADHGATVVKLEPPGGDLWRSSHPKFFKQLNRGKHSVEVDLHTDQGRRQVEGLLARADMFVTNWPVSELAAVGLAHDSLRQERPELVYVLVSPFGKDGPEEHRGGLGSGYMASGIASMMAGAPPACAKQLPTQFMEMLSSMYLFGALSCAHFHKERTGEGQFVELVMLRVGYWSAQVVSTWCVRDPAKYAMLQIDPKSYFLTYPVPAFMAHKTKDGLWVQLLGVDTPRHLPRTLKALGITGSAIFAVAKALLFEVIPNRNAPSFTIRATPIFGALNTKIHAAFAQHTWQELHAKFQLHDVWHCPVRMPRQLHGYAQVHEIRALRDDCEGTKLVATPTELETTPSGHPLPSTPSLGQHNDLHLGKK